MAVALYDYNVRSSLWRKVTNFTDHREQSVQEWNSGVIICRPQVSTEKKQNSTKKKQKMQPLSCKIEAQDYTNMKAAAIQVRVRSLKVQSAVCYFS